MGKKLEYKNLQSLLVSESIYVMLANTTYVRLEWDSNPVNDMLADSVLSLILQIQANPSTQSLIQNSCCSNQMEKVQTLCCFLRRHYDQVDFDERSRIVTITVNDDITVTIDLNEDKVICDDEEQCTIVKNIL